jgi:hypothetical protein
MARRKEYSDYINPQVLRDVQAWAKQGETEDYIKHRLGLGNTVWARFMAENRELRDAVKEGRKDLCVDLKSTLTQLAHGYIYTEKKTIRQGDQVRVEIYEKTQRPSEAAISMLLKNYDPDWSDDPKGLAIKREKLELDKKAAQDRVQLDTWQPPVLKDVQQSS